MDQKRRANFLEDEIVVTVEEIKTRRIIRWTKYHKAERNSEHIVLKANSKFTKGSGTHAPQTAILTADVCLTKQVMASN